MRIALTLSGGGLRAASFHLGVMARLAHEGVLEQVDQLSTVSGGSIAAAAVFGAPTNWPTSTEFLAVRYPEVRQLITQRGLFGLRSMTLGMFARHNTDILLHRANILADQLVRLWGIDGTLDQLPKTPTWWINSTNIDTGKNWRFSRDEMGDWVHGRHYIPRFLIAEAVAASAAVPYVIGALKLYFHLQTGTRPILPLVLAASAKLWRKQTSDCGTEESTRILASNLFTSPESNSRQAQF